MMKRYVFRPASASAAIGHGPTRQRHGVSGDVVELDDEHLIDGVPYPAWLAARIPGVGGVPSLVPVVEDQAPPAPPPPRVEAPIVPPAPAAPEVAPKKRGRKPKAAGPDTAPAVEDEETEDEGEGAGPEPAAPEGA